MGLGLGAAEAGCEKFQGAGRRSSPRHAMAGHRVAAVRALAGRQVEIDRRRHEDPHAGQPHGGDCHSAYALQRYDDHRHGARKKIDALLASADEENKQGVVRSAGRLVAALVSKPRSRKGLAGAVYLASQLERTNYLLEQLLKVQLRRPI